MSTVGDIIRKTKRLNEGVEWSYFDKFEKYDEPYLPPQGEGETLATQAVTASTKLVYKWYNDGDVYDNSYYMPGWANDLSSYANWLAKYIDGAKSILDRISKVHNDGEYEEILKDLCDLIYDDEYLKKLNEQPKEGSIYDCDGDYEFNPNKYDEELDEDSEPEESIVGTYEVYKNGNKCNIEVRQFNNDKSKMYAVDNPFKGFEWGTNFYKTEDAVKKFLSKHNAKRKV